MPFISMCVYFVFYFLGFGATMMTIVKRVMNMTNTDARGPTRGTRTWEGNNP
jgi:F0F1-type ATP synthase assembly protein I